MTVSPSPPERDPSWMTARGYAHLIGPMPSLYVEAIDVLWKAHRGAQGGAPVISSEIYEAVKFFERSPKLKVPIYFAATSLYPERFESNTEDDLTRATISVLRPGLYAAIVILLFYHRRLKKMLPETPLSMQLSEEYITAMESGFVVGLASETPGDAMGMLLSAMRVAALGAFLAHDATAFSMYRRTNHKPWDVEHERQVWGCDHGQIASILMHDLHLHRSLYELAVVFRQDFSPHIKLPPEVAAWRSALWLIDYGQVPSAPLPPPEHTVRMGIIEQYKVELLMSRIQLLAEGSSTFSWMMRSSRDDPDGADSDAP